MLIVCTMIGDEMRELPILFNTEMVKAVLDSKKTQTRRLMKPQPPDWSRNTYNFYGAINLRLPDGKLIRYPYGQTGDRLYVRETFLVMHRLNRVDRIYYRADGDDPLADTPYSGWVASIHMPKKYARIWLEVTDVCIERVQDISWQDARAEGIKDEPRGDLDKTEYYWRAFRNLWNSIYAKSDYGWDANPWVWVVEFKKLDS